MTCTVQIFQYTSILGQSIAAVVRNYVQCCTQTSIMLEGSILLGCDAVSLGEWFAVFAEGLQCLYLEGSSTSSMANWLFMKYLTL